MIRVVSLSAVTGAIWGAIAASPLLLNDPAGMNAGISIDTALLSGATTGVVVGLISLPVYRSLSGRHLIWLAPISLYLAIAVFSGLVCAFFPPKGSRGFLQLTFGAWWALTLWFTLWPLFALAFANHAWLRSFLRKA